MKGHWLRLALLLGILAVMVGINFISDDLYVVMAALLVIVLPVANWTVFGILLWAHNQSPEIESLSDRVDDQLTLALASTVGGLIGVFAFADIIFDFRLGSLLTVGLGFIIVIISLPGITFLQTWRDIWLPMVRKSQKDAQRGEFEAEQQSGMDAMEDRLQRSIHENTEITEEARDNAQDAFKEANTINQKIAAQGAVLVQQGEDRAAERAAGLPSDGDVSAHAAEY